MRDLNRKPIAELMLCVLVLLGIACSADPGPVGMLEVQAFTGATVQATPTAVVDPRLDALNITITAAEDCTLGCWRVESVQFEDSDQSGGMHHIFGRVRVDETTPAGWPWHVAYPDNDIRIFTKEAPEWADFPMFAGYNPNEGQCGPYLAYAGESIARSAVVRCMGLPLRQHVNFRIIWEWVPPDSTTPVPLPTATITAVPCGACTERLYLPIISVNP